MIYHHLYKYNRKKDCVFAGLIGAGQYGTAVVTQEKYTPYLKVAAVADVTADKAKLAYEKAEIDPSRLVYCSTAGQAQEEIAKGNYVYTDKSEIISQIPAIDIICESTGIPEASARHALDAINNGKHVAMITKDCDASVGPILKKLADDKGVVYTPVDGDQHGLLIQMVEWAKSIGLTILCGGKATDGEFVYDRENGTVTIQTDKHISPPFQETVKIADEDRKYLEKIPEGKVEEYLAKRARIFDSLPHPGSYDLCEMTIAANYTGMKPQVDTLIHAPLRITELPIAYCTEDHGGVFKEAGAIDLATCLRYPDESGLGGGVYLVVRCDNAYSNYILTTKGQIANYDNSAAVIYRPYHLCGVETSSTILVAGLLGFNTGSDTYLPRFDLVKTAAQEIKAGDVFGNDHSSQLTAKILPAVPIAPGNPAAAHLLTGNRAKVDIPKGTMITYDMVEEPEKSTLWELRRLQDKIFLNAD